ncbi:ankyrin repeat domain-containing protein [uncultured Paludibaculum sp.]|uniref:ankyrin repeat domain-containing protein n=1 Tax=uncultured Paludibaculum sp. TaxID=1765020 RepID=UPI002AAAA129|nr:ankyrin repeat domain-containing protein [uncultured Paludibaculum sp.]
MIATLSELMLSLSNSPGLAIAGKATLILSAGLAGSALAWRSRASVRHLILASTFGSLLALPFVVALAPPVVVRVASLPAHPTRINAGDTSASDVPLSPSASVRQLPVSGPIPSWVAPSLGTVLEATWLTGAAVLLALLALENWRLRRLRRSGLPAPSLDAHLKSQNGRPLLPSRVDLLLHEKVPAPLTCGTLRPAIFLPADARTWKEADLRRALIHELEHVRRFDWATQLLARTACALLWFHPLAWMAWRRLSLEAERACDDAVVLHEEGVDYAEQLVTLARQYAHGAAAPALGMAYRSDLSARVRAILDDRQSRGRAGLSAAVTALALSFVLLVSIAPLRAVAQVAADDREDGVTSADRALFEAAERGDVGEVERLIAGGANVNARLEGDGSPLIAAARNGHDSAVEALLNRGADANLGVQGDGSPLIVAARRGHLSTVQLLLDRGADVRKPVPGDGNPLIMAARGGHVNIVEYLLTRGADIEQVVPGDENALIEACASGHLPVVEFLVRKGANVNARVLAERNLQGQEEWRTPLGMALRNGHKQVVAYLQSVGAHE